MKTFISDIIPKIQRFSQKLDNLTLLTNHHWVVVDDNDATKHVYIFRSNNELLISQNGRVEKAKWEYLGHDAILIDRKEESYLFRHGFFDEHILALKTDGKQEYAFMVNESKYSGELNSAAKVLEFLQTRYITSPLQFLPQHEVQSTVEAIIENREANTWAGHVVNTFKTSAGTIEFIKNNTDYVAAPTNRVLLNGRPAPDGKYKIGFMFYIHVKDGVLVKDTIM